MPEPHHQPTKEELEEKVKDATDIKEEDLENTPEDEPEEGTPDESGTPDTMDLPPTDDVPEDETPEEPEPKEAEPSKELYKKKFSSSSRENQKINAKNRVMNQAVSDAVDIPEPTEEEMESIYKDDWDLMSDIDKELAKETIISRKWRAKIKDASDQATKIEKWSDSVDEFVDDPKTLINNPDLEGKTEEFKEFATDATNNSVPFNILVSAFLHDHSTNKPSNKGRMFERDKGGPNDKPQPKSDKVTLEEARRIRETDYPKYKELLENGKIEMNI